MTVGLRAIKSLTIPNEKKVLPGKELKAQADRAATNGGTLEARRAGTNTAV